LTPTPARSSPSSSGWKAETSPGGAFDLAVGQHGAGSVLHRGEQVDLAAVWCAGTAERLAVDRDGPAAPLSAVAVGQPGADRGRQGVGIQAAQGPAKGGLGRGAVVVRAIAAGAERGPDWLGVSAAHSAIAVIERAPVSATAAAMARTAMSGWRRPREARGSGMMGRQARASVVVMRLW
jgi:hypothetical protein